jgi:hypothetical protein
MPRFFVEHLEALASPDAAVRQARHDQFTAMTMKYEGIIPISDLSDGQHVYKSRESSCTKAGSSPAFSAINISGQAYKAWAVPSKNANHPFSESGDSGAVVWTGGPTGPSVCGLVIGGARGNDTPSADVHITYITPMEWILDDLKNSGFNVILL